MNDELTINSSEVPADQWLVEGLLPRRGVTLLGGALNAGKTVTALQISLCVAADLPVFGRRLFHPGPVIHVIADSSLRSLATWLGPLTDGLGITTTGLPLYVVNAAAVLGSGIGSPVTESLLGQVEELSTRIKPALVVFDGALAPLVSNENEGVSLLMSRLQDLALNNDGVVLVTVHTSKRTSFVAAAPFQAGAAQGGKDALVATTAPLVPGIEPAEAINYARAFSGPQPCWRGHPRC